MGTNIIDSSRFIVVDKSKNVFISSDYTMASKLGAVTVTIFSVDLSCLGKNPSQQHDLGAVVSVAFVVGGVNGRISRNTPFNVQVDLFSTVILTASSAHG